MILVTGATGFVGQRVIYELEKRYGHNKIICLMWNKYISHKNKIVEKTGKKILTSLKVKTIAGDLVTGEGLDKLPLNIDLVINIAANTNTSDPNQQCNDVGVVNLLESLKTIGPKTHFIQISTVAIAAGRSDFKKGINENTPTNPTNEYGRSKLRAEEYLKKMCQVKKFRLTIIRLNTVYGKNSRPDSMLDLLVKWIKTDSIITRINWPGKTSIIWVEDAAKAISSLSLMRPKTARYQIYTLYAESLSLSAMSAQIHVFLKKPYKSINLPLWSWRIISRGARLARYFESIMPADLYNTIWRIGLIVDDVVYCNTNKAFRTLPGWKPKIFSSVVNRVIT